MNQKRFDELLKDDNVIKTEFFDAWDMAWVFLNDEQIYIGNLHDYYTSCYSGWNFVSRFDNHRGFIASIVSYVKEQKKKIIEVEDHISEADVCKRSGYAE